MYKYTYEDQAIVDERVEQFRDQTRRFLDGTLADEEYRPLRLQNGLYIQRHAPMLRIAIPYGLLASYQLRKLAEISKKYDRGYGHFTTRTNIQLNWLKLEDVPEVLAELATVQMHAIQTSGNCIRNTTTDPYAGVNSEEIADPRPYCEIIRQWSTFHPEFAFLPRKFKIAVIGSKTDRAATQVHDIGLHLVENRKGEIGFEVIVGGGLGRTPIIGKLIKRFLPREHLLSYLDAILRVYNLHGRRDHKYKSRIKILVEEMGEKVFTKMVEDEWKAHCQDGSLTLTDEHFTKAQSYFTAPKYEEIDQLQAQTELDKQLISNQDFANWYKQNTVPHKVAGYRAVVISLKAGNVNDIFIPPGDVTSEQMYALADLTDKYSDSEIRSTHQQNLVFSDVKISNLFILWTKLNEINLARPNINTLTDMIVCPGMDYCGLAEAYTHSVAEDINRRFNQIDYLYDLGNISLNMSGCMNSCAHQHVGDIGIQGVDKRGESWYQIMIGGSSNTNAKLAELIGKPVSADKVADSIQILLDVYISNRNEDESFGEVVDRISIDPFKEAIRIAGKSARSKSRKINNE